MNVAPRASKREIRALWSHAARLRRSPATRRAWPLIVEIRILFSAQTVPTVSGGRGLFRGGVSFQISPFNTVEFLGEVEQQGEKWLVVIVNPPLFSDIGSANMTQHSPDGPDNTPGAAS